MQAPHWTQGETETQGGMWWSCHSPSGQGGEAMLVETDNCPGSVVPPANCTHQPMLDLSAWKGP